MGVISSSVLERAAEGGLSNAISSLGGGALGKSEDFSLEGFGASNSCPAVMRRSPLSLMGRVRYNKDECMMCGQTFVISLLGVRD